jgi:uncharacterized protein
MSPLPVIPGDILAKARLQADERGLDDVFIVDADAHHYELNSWAEVVEYIPDPIVRNLGRNPRPGRPGLIPPPLGTTDTVGRLMRGRPELPAGDAHPDIAATCDHMDAMGVDVSLVVPSLMQFLGLHPQANTELNIAYAYNEWLVEKIIPESPRIRPFLYLPFNTPDGCEKMIDRFGDAKSTAGFMISSTRYRAVHDNAYMRTYAMLEERGLPLAFHSGHDWLERPTDLVTRFLSVYAMSGAQFNMLHMTNWIVSGLPERFPKLDLVWMEAGLAWLPYLMQRLDSNFAMRSSEAPALKRRPSDYMRDMYYTSHPIEATGDEAGMEALEHIFKRIDAPNRLMWASGFPQWNFDTPSALWDLPFLDDATRRGILGGTAKQLFGLA